MSLFRSRARPAPAVTGTVGVVVDGPALTAVSTVSGGVERFHDTVIGEPATLIGPLLATARPGDRVVAVWSSPLVQATTVEVSADLLSKRRFVSAAASKFADDAALGLVSPVSGPFTYAGVLADPHRARTGQLVAALALRAPTAQLSQVLSWFPPSVTVQVVSVASCLLGGDGVVLWLGFAGASAILYADGAPVACAGLPTESVWEICDRLGSDGLHRFTAAFNGQRGDPVASASAASLCTSVAAAARARVNVWARAGWNVGAGVFLAGTYAFSPQLRTALTAARFTAVHPWRPPALAGLSEARLPVFAAPASAALAVSTFGPASVLAHRQAAVSR